MYIVIISGFTRTIMLHLLLIWKI